MGKKTDAFIKKMNDQSDVCMTTSMNLLKVIEAWPAVDAEWDKWENAMRAMGKDWDQHPYYVKRLAVWAKGKELARRLRDETNAMLSTTTDFSAYIAKKEKSKNPFKSKKSLPAAKDAVKAINDSAKVLDGLAAQGLKTFH